MIPIYSKNNPYHPAWHATVAEAVRMVKAGYAQFVNRNTALQLTERHLPQMRDISAQVKPVHMVSYCLGSQRVRQAVDCGWGHA
jgi:hypothetical protein